MSLCDLVTSFEIGYNFYINDFRGDDNGKNKEDIIAEMTDFLNKQSRELEEYDEQLVRRLIEKVTIYEAKLTVEFKSGIEIDEEI